MKRPSELPTTTRRTWSIARRHAEAKALLRKMTPVARRVLGESHEITLHSRTIYAQALYADPDATLDDDREAVTTLEDAERTARRVLAARIRTWRRSSDPCNKHESNPPRTQGSVKSECELKKHAPPAPQEAAECVLHVRTSIDNEAGAPPGGSLNDGEIRAVGVQNDGRADLARVNSEPGELEAAPRPRDVRLRAGELVLELERRDGAVALGVVAARLADDQIPKDVFRRAADSFGSATKTNSNVATSTNAKGTKA